MLLNLTALFTVFAYPNSLKRTVYKRVIDTAVRQWRTRLPACVTAKGGHFEQNLELVVSNVVVAHKSVVYQTYSC